MRSYQGVHATLLLVVFALARREPRQEQIRIRVTFEKVGQGAKNSSVVGSDGATSGNFTHRVRKFYNRGPS
jgi:hypothetical protein